jgi:hypothetical protein
MPMQAQFPSWMMFVLIMMFMGPMMRLMFGGGRSKQDRLDGSSRNEIKRLENTLAERDGMLEDLQHRMSELESRLDFTERLLAERKDPVHFPER